MLFSAERVLGHASVFELIFVVLVLTGISVVVRNVLRRRGAGDDVGQAIRTTLRRGARTGGLVGGGFLAVLAAGAAFGLFQILVLIAIFAAIGGDDSAGWMILGGLGAVLFFSILAIWLFVRAARRFLRNRRAVLETSTEPRQRTLVGDLGVCITVLAGTGFYLALFVAQPAWVADPGCKPAGWLVDVSDTSTTTSTTVPVLDESPAEVAARYGIEPLPLFAGGHPNEVRVLERADGGVTISVRGGTHRNVGDLKDEAERAVRERGWTFNGRSSTSGSAVADSFSVGFKTPSYTGGISVEECGGYRQAALVIVSASIPAERSGVCAPKARHEICDVLRAAGDAVDFDGAPIVERPDGRLMIEVAPPGREAFGSFAGLEAREYARALDKLGWTIAEQSDDSSDPFDSFDSFDSFADRVTVTATRDEGRYRVTLEVVDQDDVFVSGRIETRDPAPR